jgi:hypothetical protein
MIWLCYLVPDDTLVMVPPIRKQNKERKKEENEEVHALMQLWVHT